MNDTVRLLITISVMMVAGCASLSKTDCENANWRAIGYKHGQQGIHHRELEKFSTGCSEYDIVPDREAYLSGWDEGIRQFCTPDTGYSLGASGQPLRNVCPADLAASYRDGWEQGVRTFCNEDQGYRLGSTGARFTNICPVDLQEQFRLGWERGIRSYCSPRNGFSRGLSAKPEPEFCPDDLRYAFHDQYRLGRDLHDARQRHDRDRRGLEKLDRELSGNAAKHRKSLLRELQQARHLELESRIRVTALQACADDNWYEAGFRDGEAGVAGRQHLAVRICRSYGITPSMEGYAQGWFEGIHYYCNYDHGLYMGRANLSDNGICAGKEHWRFHQGFEHGRNAYLKETESFREHVGMDRGSKGRVIDPASVKSKFPVSGAIGNEVPRPGDDDRPERPESDQDEERGRGGDEVHDNRDKLKHPMPEQSQGNKEDKEREGKAKDRKDKKDRDN